jgi:ribulose-5-phosphate 4-epimerase/fuculose-1-phosphate aldolase
MEDLIKLSKKVSKYCVGMEGNISKKNGEFILIKASGGKLDLLTSDDIVMFDFNSKQLDNFNRTGSIELGFHIFLLGFEEIKFVSHTHPINTLKILCSNLSSEFASKRMFPEQVVFNNSVTCLVPYAKPGDDLTKMIANHVSRFINKHNHIPKLILLENHGIITCGATIDECVIINDICEKAAEIFIGAKTLGVRFLGDDDVNYLITDKKEKYRKDLL